MVPHRIVERYKLTRRRRPVNVGDRFGPWTFPTLVMSTRSSAGWFDGSRGGDALTDGVGDGCVLFDVGVFNRLPAGKFWTS